LNFHCHCHLLTNYYRTDLPGHYNPIESGLRI
jgi:hypothetical protein